ncbi:hypothetical protein C1645_820592 [Glomus cerebriforme]|uniref:Uncharacterized protein n=1 Tax=Glomus cerebriforme TaxID=658196 RepID=A0A397TCF0_9GLOM|nr:hypothetical protein C1645_820592 [Glomus cerebriforme]
MAKIYQTYLTHFQKSLNYGNSISENNIEQMLKVIFEDSDILNEDENKGVSEPESNEEVTNTNEILEIEQRQIQRTFSSYWTCQTTILEGDCWQDKSATVAKRPEMAKCTMKNLNQNSETEYDRMRKANQAVQVMLSLNSVARSSNPQSWDNDQDEERYLNNVNNQEADNQDAVCYIINIQFTADANSTQHIESLNKKVYDINYIRIQEYKDEIPSVELENIVQKYFTSIEEIVSDYLMVPMIIPVCKQMQECFYYDAFMFEITQ